MRYVKIVLASALLVVLAGVASAATFPETGGASIGLLDTLYCRLTGSTAGRLTKVTGANAIAEMAGITSADGNALVVAGDLTVDTATLVVNSATNFVGIGIAAPEVELDVRANVNGFSQILMLNSNAGASAASSVAVSAGGRQGTLIAYNPSHASQPSKISLQSETGSTGVDIMARDPSASIRFFTGGVTQRARITNDGIFEALGAATVGTTLTVTGATTMTGRLNFTGGVTSTMGQDGSGNTYLGLGTTKVWEFNNSSGTITHNYATNFSSNITVTGAVRAASTVLFLTPTTSAPVCAVNSHIGLYSYSKTAGATISICSCTKLSNVFTVTALGTGDCS